METKPKYGCISKDSVLIHSGSGHIVFGLKIRPSGKLDLHKCSYGEEYTDAAVLRLLRNAINCLLDTGGFLALEGEYGKFYVGQTVWVDQGKREATVVSVDNPQFIMVQFPDKTWCSYVKTEVQPFYQKQYRPYTPEEAAKFLGRCFIKNGGDISHAVRAVTSTGIEYVVYNQPKPLTYQNFLDGCYWDGSAKQPCGVPVE